MIVAVCGLLREARLLSRYGVKAVIGNAVDVTPDIRGIVSIGIAGALAPELEAGDAVIAERVVTACDAFETDAKWTARIAARLPNATIGAILGRGTIADNRRGEGPAPRLQPRGLPSTWNRISQHKRHGRMACPSRPCA